MSGLTLALTLQVLALPAASFTISEIEPRGELQNFWTADIDGDSRLDLLLAIWTRDAGRGLEIHLQDEAGAFAASPERRVDIKSDIIAFASADLRPEPGAELLLFTRSTCFSYSTTLAGYAGNVRRLFSGDFLCAIPDRKGLSRLGSVLDVDGDGKAEVLLPTVTSFELHGTSAEGFVRRQTFPLRWSGMRVRSDTAHRFDVSPRSGFRHRRTSALAAMLDSYDDGETRPILESEHWVPSPVFLDTDGDGRLDLVYVEKDVETRRLLIFRQGASGDFRPEADWRGELEGEGNLRTVDPDHDGRVDLLIDEEKSRGDTSLRFHMNRGGRFDLEKPDQVLKVSGFRVRPRCVDLDRDGHDELVVSSLSISAIRAIKDGNVLRSVLIYRGDAKGVFERRPAAKYETAFSAREAKGLAITPLPDVDLDGDGRYELLSGDPAGGLVSRSFDGDLDVREDPIWRYTPRRTILRVHRKSLNGDRRDDLLLRHMKSLTVLVSR